MQENLHQGGTLGQVYLTAIGRHAQRPALADGRQSWTYAQFGEAIGKFITVYRELGLQKGRGVSVLSGNRVEVVAAQVAALLMGARYTPLHPKAGADDHAFIVEDAEIDLLVVDGTPFFAERGCHIAARVPSLRRLLSFGAVAGATDLLPLLAAAASEGRSRSVG